MLIGDSTRTSVDTHRARRKTRTRGCLVGHVEASVVCPTNNTRSNVTAVLLAIAVRATLIWWQIIAVQCFRANETDNRVDYY